MTDLCDYRLSDRYERDAGRVFLTGVQALARIPIEQLRRDRRAGLDTAAFLSGYPGSPLGGFDLEVARALRIASDLPIVLQPAVNEELAATSVMGSQLASTRPDARYDGVVGIWYGKAPGLDRAGDAMRHGVFAGSSRFGGAVALVGDDPAAKSSTMPSSSDATLVDLHMPILYPGTTAECVELGLHAIAMSRASGLWSSLKIVTAVADGSGTVDLPVLGDEPVLPTVEIDGKTWVSHPSAHFLGPRMVAVEREFREVRARLAYDYGVLNGLNRVSVDPDDAWVGIVATGFTYYEVLDALRRLGFDGAAAIAAAGIRLLQLRMPVPFDGELVRRFARGLAEVVVIEEKNPTLEWLIKDALYSARDRPVVVGKTHEDGRLLVPSWGRLDADTIMPGLRERLAARLDERLAPIPPPPRPLIPLSVWRTPFFCAGCPHNWGTKVPESALVGAGTGCHGMTLLMDESRVGESIGITAMGNEGAQWVGMAPFVDGSHLAQNYGDGTFFHSGQLAIQYCIAAGVNITFKILYNGTVAMTGGQDSISAVGVPELVQILLAHGAARVAVTTDDPSDYRAVELPAGVQVHDRADIVAVQAELRAVPGVTVLIHEQDCAAELRRARKRGRAETPKERVVINHRICEGCGDCGDVSNCLSVQPVDTPLGRKTQIDQASCNFDFSCLKGDCPAFMTVVAGDTAAPAPTVVPVGPLRDPSPAVSSDLVRIRMAGIGGTGVVTVAQILSIAAMIDGWEVRGLDQTGLSQKAGPVVSDVTLARGAGFSNLVGTGQADVILAFDELVAASDQAVTAGSPRSLLYVATDQTPTGAMISHPGLAYPASDALLGRFAGRADLDNSRFVAATDLTVGLVGSAGPANVFLLGVAVQTGAIPVSVAAIERGIELNGVAVESNLGAFAWGRRWADEPDAVTTIADERRRSPLFVTVPALPEALVTEIEAITDDGDLRATLELLTADLAEYQDGAYAAAFVADVRRASVVEHRIAPGSTRLTETVARSMHKLMAYKDEYEVARLMLLPEAQAIAESAQGSGATSSWQLHPPALAAFGLNRKIALSHRARPVFVVLRAAKRLRGTRWDPFGRTEMRRLERALPDELRTILDTVYDGVSPRNLDAAIEIAGLPDMIRGYEDLKLRRVAEYRAQMLDALAAFRDR